MDSTTFDGIARTLSNTSPRRSALRGLFAAAAATVAGGALLRADDASAKRRRKKTRAGGQTQTLPIGARCQSSSQCPESYICEVAVNASNSDRTCCGAQGAGCGAKNEDGDDTAPFCCVGFACVFHNGNGSWTCEAVPDEN